LFAVHVQILSRHFLLLPHTAWSGGGLFFHRVFRILMLALAFGLALPATAAATQPTTIRVNAPDALRKLLQSYLSIWQYQHKETTAGQRAGIVRAAKREIPDLLATQGYFSPQVATDIQSSAAGETVVITVKPGPRTHVAAVTLNFKGDIAGGDSQRAARRDTLRSQWPLKAGAPFTQDDWSHAKQALLQALSGEDYAAASIADSRAEIDPAHATAKLSVTYDSGPPFTLDHLDISGLKRYPSGLITELNPIKPGSRYSEKQLLELQRKLQDLPYFSSVIVDIKRDPAHHTDVPVEVRVSEAKSKHVGFGTGYSTNYGVRGEFNYRDNNLLDRGWMLSSGLHLDQKRQIGFGEVYLPPTGRGFQDSFGALGEHTDIEGLRTDRGAVGVARTRKRGRVDARLELKFQRERQEVSGIPTQFVNALTLDYLWSWKHVDNPLDPRRGQVLTLEVGGGSKALLSTQNFVRSYGRYQQYFPVGRSDVLIGRAELGYTAAPSRDGIPQEFLFRAGGTGSVRGYDYQSLGVDENGAVVGGRYLVTASAEYVHWLTDKWGIATFYDIGDAADSRATFQWHAGYGVGARWKSPAGPLAIDLAYGQQERQFRIHFAVAAVF
jgi:translocation and assembly module TamA